MQHMKPHVRFRQSQGGRGMGPANATRGTLFISCDIGIHCTTPVKPPGTSPEPTGPGVLFLGLFPGAGTFFPRSFD